MKFVTTFVMAGCLCALMAGAAFAQNGNGNGNGGMEQAAPAKVSAAPAPYVMYYTPAYGSTYGYSAYSRQGYHPYQSYYSHHRNYYRHHGCCCGGGGWYLIDIHIF